MGAVLAVLLCSIKTVRSEKNSLSQLNKELKEAEGSYSSKDYAKAEDILVQLSHSFPKAPQYTYFQLMIAKCEYHLKNYDSAQEKFKDFIHQFPQSRYIASSYYLLGNTTYLLGKIFESAQNFVLAYQLAETSQLKDLSQTSLEPLLEKWLSEKELEKLSQTEKDKKLAHLIFFHLGKRNVENKNYAKALEALNYYRDNFPKGKDIQEVNLLIKEASSSSLPVIKVGVLASLGRDFSNYGTSFVNGIQLALSSYTPEQKRVELVVKDTEGDLMKTGSLCRDLIEEDRVVCILGPLESESVVKAADVAENARIPLVTPASNKEGLTSLGNCIFELFPSEARMGKSMAEFVVRSQVFSDFVMLIPEPGGDNTKALNFKNTVEALGGKILAVEYYPPGTVDFSPYIERIKKALLGITSSSPPEESGSFFDQMPARVDGFFLSADQKDWPSVFSNLVDFKVYTTVISMEWRQDPQFLDLAKSLNQKLIFTTDKSPSNEEEELSSTGSERENFLKLYQGKYKKEPGQFLLEGYDCMKLLLSIFEEAATPEKIAAALSSTADFKGVAGEISFDSERENIYIPIYKLESGEIKRLR